MEDVSWSDIKPKPPPGRRCKKKKPKGGYVYLFERISLRSFRSIFTGQREIKIGITERQAWRRLREVDRAVIGKVIKIHQQWYPDPRAVEKRLHDMFENEKFRPKAVRGGGGLSEWFRMNRREFRQLKRELDVSSAMDAVLIGLLIIFIYFVFLILKVWLKT